MGKEAQDYEVRNLPAQFGIAFMLTKLSVQGPTVSYHCNVNAENPQDVETLCDCTGHQRYGYCKHPRVITRLLERGELRTVHTEPPAAPAPDRYANCPF